MPRIEIEFIPVDHITADAVGPQGQRAFYLQGTKGTRIATLTAEKFQIQSLAVGIEQFLAEIAHKFPDIPDASADYDEAAMHIQPPIDPLFRLADIGLGYSAENDLVVLVIHELLPEDSQEDPGVVRLWCMRSQLRALSHWSMEVASRGRPICPQCGQPEEPEGHFCVKKNGGHKRN